MKLKLKEDPREWQKFAAVLAGFLTMVLLWLFRRKGLPEPVWAGGLGLLAALLTIALFRPRWFRGPYRFTLQVSFPVGQLMGRILLTCFFLFILTPLGLALRLAGKDLLHLRRENGSGSYWRPARPTAPFDRLF